MSKTLKAVKPYEIERKEDGRAIVHFQPQATDKAILSLAFWIALQRLLIVLGLIPGALVAAILVGESSDYAVRIMLGSWGAMAVAAYIKVLFEEKKHLAPGSLATTIELDKDSLRVSAKDMRLERADIDRVFVKEPDTSFTYKRKVEHDLKKANAARKARTENGVYVDYGGSEVRVVSQVLTPLQAEHIANLITTWKNNPDQVLTPA